MTVALPAVVNVEFYRGDGGAPNAEVDFGHDFTWGNVTEAKFYVRKAPGGDLLVAITKTLHPSRWVDNGDGTAYVRLMASDTDGKPDGLWWYDIELTSSQRTQTVQRGRFHLLGDIAGNTGSIITLPGQFAVPGNVYDALVNAQNPSFGNVFVTQSALTAQLAPLLAGGTYFGQNVWPEVRVATTGNITLSGLQTVDGISLGANDRALVKNQTAAAANGIYVAAGAGILGQGVVVSEFGYLTEDPISVAQMTALTADVEARLWVLTSAWFSVHYAPWASSDLLRADGSLTELGAAWVAR